jgi:hypothetical protein
MPGDATMHMTENRLRTLIREMIAGQGLPWGGVREGDEDMWLSLYDEETRDEALHRCGGDPHAAMQWLVSKMGTAGQ